MDLSMITMDREKARVAFSEYRRAVKDRHDDEDLALMRGHDEDLALMRGYRELARGHQLLNLRDAIGAGGMDDDGRPRLAVTNADRRWCWLRSYSGSIEFSPDRWTKSSRARQSGVYRFPPGTLVGVGNHYADRRAMVPIVPPALRPARALSNYAVLWEATWEQVPRPPGDPALLRHISGDLYAVLAIWDLTELERAVLGARALES